MLGSLATINPLNFIGMKCSNIEKLGYKIENRPWLYQNSTLIIS